MAKRVDANQKRIVADLRAVGVSVISTHTIGNGFADIVCGYKTHNFLFEIKDPSQSAGNRKLTEDEQNFHALWRGQIHVIATFDEAWSIIQARVVRQFSIIP